MFLINYSKKGFSQLVRRDRVTGIFAAKKERKPDRFNLHLINTPDKLFELARNPLENLSLNENISILHRITQVSNNSEKKIQNGSQEIIQRINSKLNQVQEENIFIGRLAYALKRLNYYKNINTWVQMKDYLIANLYDDEYDEILNLVKGFDQLQFQLKEEWQVELYYKSFHNLTHIIFKSLQQGRYSIWDIKDLLMYLTKNNFKLNESIYEEIQFQIIKLIYKSQNLENDKEEILLNDVVYLAYYCCLGEFKTDRLHDYIQEQFQSAIEQRNLKQILQGSGLSQYIQWVNFYYKDQIFTSPKSIQCILFKQEYIVYSIFNQKFVTNIQDQLSVYYYLKNIEYQDQEDKMKLKLRQILLGIDKNEECNLNQIQEYIEIIFQEEKNKNLDNDTCTFLDDLKFINAKKFNSASLFFYLNFLEEHVIFQFQQILEKFPNFFFILPAIINKSYNELQFDDTCYFYVIFTLNQHIAAQRTIKSEEDFYSNLNNLQQHIKFVTLRRGFKIGIFIIQIWKVIFIGY